MAVENEELLDEKTIACLDEAKKGKPRKFAMVCKGAKVVSLVVYKKGSLDKYKKQAKESGKGQFYHGVIDGKGVNLTFQLARADGFEKEPGPATQLKQFLSEKADLKVTPSYEIVDALPPVLDADDPLTARFLTAKAAALEAAAGRADKVKEVNDLSLEIGKLIEQEDAAAEAKIQVLEAMPNQLGTGGQQPPSTETQVPPPPPPPAPPPAPPTSDHLAEFTDRLKKLKPAFDQGKSATSKDVQTKVAEAANLAKQAGALAQKKDFDAAFGLLDKAGELLQDVGRGAADSNLEAQCLQLKNTVYPQVKPAVLAAPALKDELVNLLNQASKQEKAGAFSEAIATYQQLETKVKQALSGKPKPTEENIGGISVMKLGKARVEWRTTREEAIASMERLKEEIESAYAADPDMKSEIAAALLKLDGVFAKLNNDLYDQLDDVLNESDPTKRANLAKIAKKTMQEFTNYVNSDPIMRALDGNEFLPKTEITGPISDKLQEIAAALGEATKQ